MTDENQQNQEQQDAPAPESFASTSTEANITSEVKGPGDEAGDQSGADSAAVDSTANESGAAPTEGAADTPNGAGTETPAPADQSPAEEVDVVTLARAKHQIDEIVSDALVIEYINAVGDGSADINLGAWSTDLLLVVLKGLIRFPESELKNLIVVYRQRIEIPSAWADKGVIEYLRAGVEPKRASTGCWLVDVTRVNRVPAEWLTSELEAWAKGEIQAGGKSHDNGVAIELKARLGLKCEDTPKSVRKAYKALSPADIKVVGAEASQPVQVAAATDTDETEQLQQAKAVVALIEKVEGLTSMNVAFIDDGIAKYIESTNPLRPISEAEQLKAQNDLDTLFQYIIRLEPQSMVAGLERLKATFKKEMVGNGVFSANNVFRFTHLMRSDNNRQQRHVGLLELFRVYFADAKEARKQVSLRMLLQYQEAEKVDLLSEYFTRIA
jgi:hypothetical protein